MYRYKFLLSLQTANHEITVICPKKQNIADEGLLQNFCIFRYKPLA